MPAEVGRTRWLRRPSPASPQRRCDSSSLVLVVAGPSSGANRPVAFGTLLVGTLVTHHVLMLAIAEGAAMRVARHAADVRARAQASQRERRRIGMTLGASKRPVRAGGDGKAAVVGRETRREEGPGRVTRLAGVVEVRSGVVDRTQRGRSEVAAMAIDSGE